MNGKFASSALIAAIIAVCMTSCGEVNDSPADVAEEAVTTTAVTAVTEERREPDIAEPEETTGAPDIQPIFPEEEKPGDVQIEISYAPVVLDKYSDADFIEEISEGRYVVVYRSKKSKNCKVTVYDADSDTELNSFDISANDTLFLTPEIFYGRGFGFVTERKDIDNCGIEGCYYNTEGELINSFSFEPNDLFNTSCALASDGSAMYVSENDRAQCSCGFDYNPDFTTKIYAAYGDGTQELVTEFDHHTVLHLMGTDNNGRIAVTYRYNPEDITVYSHEEYESHSIARKKKDERGLAFISGEAGSAPELQKVYVLDRSYEHTLVYDDTFMLIDDDEIVRIYPDGEGGYSESRSDIREGLEGTYTDLYASSDGKIVVYPTYTEDLKDTTVNVVYFDNNEGRKIYEKYFEGMYVRFEPDDHLTMFDSRSGELVARYDDTAEGGRNQLFRVNIY